MRWRFPPVLPAAALALAAALTVASISASTGSPDGNLPLTTERLRSEARQLVTEGKLADALARLQDPKARVLVRADRELSYFEALAELRYQTESRSRDAWAAKAAQDGFVAFARARDDDWAAQATLDLLQSGNLRVGSIDDLFQRAVAYWSRQPRPQQPSRHLTALLLARLVRSQSIPAEHSLAPLWKRILELEPSVPSRDDYAESILRGAPESLPDPPLIEAIASWILAQAPPSAAVALAHEKLADVALRQHDQFAAAQELAAALSASTGASPGGGRSQNLLQGLAAAALSVDGPTLYRPRSAHCATIRTQRVARWTLELRRLEFESDVIVPSGIVGSGPPPWPRGWVRANAGALVWSYTYEDTLTQRIWGGAGGASAGGSEWHEVPLAIDPMPPGLYLVSVNGESAVPPSIRRHLREEALSGEYAFQVTSLGVLYRWQTPEALELWLIDAQTGAPIADGSLGAHFAAPYAANRASPAARGRGPDKWTSALRGDSLEWVHRALRTDGVGYARVQLRPGLSHSFVFGTAPDGRSVLSGIAGGQPWPPTTESSKNAFLLCDRTLYQPGDTVRVRGFARSYDFVRRRHVLVTGDQLDVELRCVDAFSRHDMRAGAIIDSDGGFECRLPIPSDVPQGSYEVRIRAADRRKDLGSLSLPTLRIGLLPPGALHLAISDRTPAPAALGDSLRFTVQGMYPSGQPLTGSVSATLSRRTLAVAASRWGRFQLAERTSPITATWRGGWETIQTQELVLDARGAGKVVVATPESADSSAAFSYRLTVTANTAAGAGCTAEVATRIGVSPWLAELQYDASAEGGGPGTITVHCFDLYGRATPARGTVIAERIWSDGRQPAGSWQVSIGASGVATVPFEPRAGDEYQLHFIGEAARGVSPRAHARIWSRSRVSFAAESDTAALQILPERANCMDAKSIRVGLRGSVPDGWVLITCGGGYVEQTRMVQLRNGLAHVSFPIADQQRPDLLLRALCVRDFDIHRAEARVYAPRSADLLALDAEWNASSVGPGATGTLAITARDGAGRPREVPVTVWVVDERTLTDLGQPIPDPSRAFERRPVPSLTPTTYPLIARNAYFDRAPIADGPTPLRTSGPPCGGGFPPPFDGPGIDRVADLAVARSGGKRSSTEPATDLPPGSPAGVQVIRTDLRPLALWRTDVRTGRNGRVEIPVRFPEYLTRWRAYALVVDLQTRCAVDTASIRTQQSTTILAQHPPFAREGDRQVWVATLGNSTAQPLEAALGLDVMPGAVVPITVDHHIPVGSVASGTWSVTFPAEPSAAGTLHGAAGQAEEPARTLATARWTARGPRVNDGLEEQIPLERAISRYAIRNRYVFSRSDQEFLFALPDRRAADTVSVRFASTLLASALPAINARVADLVRASRGGAAPDTTRPIDAFRLLNDALLARIAEDLGRARPELRRRVDEELARLLHQQTSEGGWTGSARQTRKPVLLTRSATGDPTRALSQEPPDIASTVRGMLCLVEMRRAGYPVPDQPLLHALDWLDQAATPQDTPELLALQLHARAAAVRELRDPRSNETAAWLARGCLERYQQAVVQARRFVDRPWIDASAVLLGHLLATFDESDDARSAQSVVALLRERVHMEDAMGWVEVDHERPGLGMDGASEASAWLCRALVARNPGDPQSAALARWLQVVLERSAREWVTNCTAELLALRDFSAAVKELEGDHQLALWLNGQRLVDLHVMPHRALVDSIIAIPSSLLRDGENRLRCTLEGSGAGYVELAGTVWSRDRAFAGSSRLVTVERRYDLLAPSANSENPTVQLREGQTLVIGDRVQVTIAVRGLLPRFRATLVDPTPSGMAIDVTATEALLNRRISEVLQAGPNAATFDHADVELGPTRELRYVLVAQHAGSFVVPPARLTPRGEVGEAASSAWATVEIVAPTARQ